MSAVDRLRAAIEAVILGREEKQRQEMERQAEEARKEGKQ
jgi:hypothetical protein